MVGTMGCACDNSNVTITGLNVGTTWLDQAWENADKAFGKLKREGQCSGGNGASVIDSITVCTSSQGRLEKYTSLNGPAYHVVFTAPAFLSVAPKEMSFDIIDPENGPVLLGGVFLTGFTGSTTVEAGDIFPYIFSVLTGMTTVIPKK